jgi:four helix bundle protein
LYKQNDGVKTMQDFKNLLVWRKAHALTLDVYEATRAFPKEEVYGLTSQLRRSASSIPANIAEGCCRSGDNELARFLYFSAGSASELEYHILLSRDLQLLTGDKHAFLTERTIEVKRMLISFIKKLKSHSQ